MSIESGIPSPEFGDDSLFEAMYATAAGRLEEGIDLQVRSERHVWQDFFSEFNHELVGFTLVAERDRYFKKRPEHFDVFLPVSQVELGESGLISSVELQATEEPYFVVSTRKYDLEHRYIVNRQTVSELNSAPDVELHDLDLKMRSYLVASLAREKRSA